MTSWTSKGWLSRSGTDARVRGALGCSTAYDGRGERQFCGM